MRGRTTALTVLVVLQVVALVAAQGGDLAGVPAAVGGGALVYGLARLVASIIFLMWVHGATRNLTALGAMNVPFTPGWAVGWYFVPFANLVMGYRVMATIWRESQPTTVDENGTIVKPKMAIVGWWWGFYLISSGGRGVVWLAALEIAAAVLFIVMVRRAQRRQDEQWDDIQRRQNQPQPSAAALR
jgi:hypothetical protein